MVKTIVIQLLAEQYTYMYICFSSDQLVASHLISTISRMDPSNKVAKLISHSVEMNPTLLANNGKEFATIQERPVEFKTNSQTWRNVKNKS